MAAPTWIEVLAIVGLFWLVVMIINRLLKLERFNIDVVPLGVMYRTRKFNNFLSWLGSKARWFWKVLWNLGIIIGIITMVFATYLIFDNFYGLLFETGNGVPIGPLLPGITIRPSSLPYMFIAMGVVLIAHEGAHGVAAVADKLKVKASGLFLFLILPGGFVELDEKEVEKEHPHTRMRISSAGSFANLLVALLISGLIFSSPLLFNPFYEQSSGLIVQDFVEDGPSYGVIPRFATIHAINGTPIQTQEDLHKYLNLVSPGDVLIIDTNLGDYSVTTAVHPSNTSRGYLGIFTIDSISYSPRSWIPWANPTFPYYYSVTLEWIWFISFNVALFNMLPVPLFDGDRVLNDVLELTLGERKITLSGKSYLIRKAILNIMRLFALSIVFGNLGLTLLRFGSFPIF